MFQGILFTVNELPRECSDRNQWQKVCAVLLWKMTKKVYRPTGSDALSFAWRNLKEKQLVHNDVKKP